MTPSHARYQTAPRPVTNVNYITRGFIKQINFRKSLLHGYIITLIFAVLSSTFISIATSADLSDISFLISIVLDFYWIFFTYAFLTGIVLFFVRKLKSEKNLVLFKELPL
jgi:hypothetical protein